MPLTRMFNRLCVVGLMTFAALMIFTASNEAPVAQADHHAAMMPAMSAMPTLQPTSINPTGLSGNVDVTIVDFAFSPAVVTITTGTVVTWTNTGLFAHTTTSDAGSSDPWDSGNLLPGGVFTRTFNIPGVYGYHCAIHSLSMFGTVVVIQPPVKVSVTGPQIGVHDSAYSFAATVNPITTTLPITFSWEATNQLPITHVNTAVSDTQVFSWTSSLTGTQWITVTASNAAGSVLNTQAIIIDPRSVYLPLILR
jgi:plastocyanin